jgi:hypothetical protein
MIILHRPVLFLILSILILSAAAITEAGPSSAAQLAGTWQLTAPSVDASGQPCPFVPDGMEFHADRTASMSNVPGGRFPYKTDVTAEEKQAVLARNPGLKGMQLLLLKPSPQMDWRSTPMVYGYRVTKNELTLTVPGYSPAKYKRLK